MRLSENADIADAVTKMCARLALPPGLAQVGVKKEMFDTIIQGALLDHCHKTNPREATAEEYRQLLNDSF